MFCLICINQYTHHDFQSLHICFYCIVYLLSCVFSVITKSKTLKKKKKKDIRVKLPIVLYNLEAIFTLTAS